MSTEPLVSICCLTYNHAPFIRECLDGFLAQQTTFPFEILIHDDASADGTDDIIREYAERYPDIIFPLFEAVNQYSNGHANSMDIEFNYSRARGKYIAYCEGDDYWTDPYKLQKQVDFMESHLDYSVCFHRCWHLYSETGERKCDNCEELFKNGEEGVDVSLDMFFSNWITQPLTMLFRKSSFSPEWYKKYQYYRDQHEIYHLLLSGKGYLFAFIGGVYRYHSGGVSSSISYEKYCETSLPIDREFYKVNRIPWAKKYYLCTLQTCIDVYSKKNKLKALKYLFIHFAVSHNYRFFLKRIIHL